MQRGMIGFPFVSGKNIVQQVVASSGQPSVLGTGQGNGAMKATIILLDSNPGTRNWITPQGVSIIRAFVVGAAGKSGGGYSEIIISVTAGSALAYTVGAPATGAGTGGTSSFNSIISATGGGATTGGVGTGGSINTSGGSSVSTGGGGASGHRYGNGGAGGGAGPSGGGGWGQAGSSGAGNGGGAFFDGFGLGIIPGNGGPAGMLFLLNPTGFSAENGGYGAGGGGMSPVTNASGASASDLGAGHGGIGGGGGSGVNGSFATGGGNGGIGGGFGAGNPVGLAGPGLVGIEVLG